MKKTILKSALAAVVGVCFMAGGVMALPLTSALQDALNVRTDDGTSSINVYTDMVVDSFDSNWEITASSQSAATLLFEFASFAEGNSFGIYDLSAPTITLELFAGTDSNPGDPFDGATTTLQVFGNSFTVDGWTTYIDFSSSTFGYYLNVANTQNTYYSDTDLNADEYDHMFAYQGQDDEFSVYNDGNYSTWNDNEYILAWEDQYAGGDQDFTDFVVMVESVQPVPEPATMLLFGIGLAGLAGYRRKKNQK